MLQIIQNRRESVLVSYQIYSSIITIFIVMGLCLIEGGTILEFSKEMIEKVSKTASVEEIIKVAGEEGITLSEEDAKEYFDLLRNSGEMSDDELEHFDPDVQVID